MDPNSVTTSIAQTIEKIGETNLVSCGAMNFRKTRGRDFAGNEIDSFRGFAIAFFFFIAAVQTRDRAKTSVKFSVDERMHTKLAFFFVHDEVNRIFRSGVEPQCRIGGRRERTYTL